MDTVNNSKRIRHVLILCGVQEEEKLDEVRPRSSELGLGLETRNKNKEQIKASTKMFVLD